MTCPSCGGLVGRDCFNPQECAEISHQEEQSRHHEAEQTGECIKQLFAIVDGLEQRIKALEALLVVR